MTDQENAGNDNSQETQVQQEPKINPGAIRKSTTQNILNALSQASGNDFASVEEAISFIAESQSRQAKNSDGNEQPKASESKDTNQENDLQEQFQKLKRDLEQKERMLTQEKLDSEIMRNMGDRFDPDLVDYALQKIKSNVKMRDGQPVIVDSQGRQRYSDDGQPLALKGLIDEIAQGNPKLLKQSQVSGGSGLRPEGNFAGAPLESIPDYARDPAAFNAWANSRGLGKASGLKGTNVTASISSGSKKIM